MDDSRRGAGDDASFDDALRRLVDDAGSDAPDPPPLDPTRRPSAPPPGGRVGWRVPLVAAAAVVALVVGLVVVSDRGGDGDTMQGGPVDTVPPPAATSTDDVAPTTSVPVAASRAINGPVAAECVEDYDLTTLAGRAWAFDGTVRSIGPTVDGAVDAAVEFEVIEWFGIDGPATVTVDLVPPAAVSTDPPEYGVGSRLLVSGEPRWGGAPLDAPVAWTCGFTRTWDEPTATAWRTTFAARTGAEPPPVVPLTRPIVDPTLCTPIYAREGVTQGVTLFARRSSTPVAMQVIADPALGPTGSFALVQRYLTDEWLRPGSETVELDGVTYQLGVLDNGNGSLEWEVGDGSIGYVRSRGLARDDLLALATALGPRPSEAPIPGFDVDTAALPPPLALLHEQLDTDVSGEVHRSACVVPGTTLEYRVSAIDGDPIFEYGGVIDRVPPLAVGVVGDSVVVIDGPADPSAPSVADVVDADQATWDELLTRSDVPAGAAFQADVTIGQGVEVQLLAFDEQVPTSTLLLRIVEQDGVAFVQIETAGAVLDPEAVLWKVDIEGRGGGLSTAAVGPVTGYRLGDAPFTGEVNLEITAIDGGDFTLQTTGPVRLVVS